MGNIKVTVLNDFRDTHRELLVYKSWDDSHEIVKYAQDVEGTNPSFNIEAGASLLIKVAPQHVALQRSCWIEFPSQTNWELTNMPEGPETYVYSREHRLRRVINAGPHAWQLKITAPAESETLVSSGSNGDDNVTVGDNG